MRSTRYPGGLEERELDKVAIFGAAWNVAKGIGGLTGKAGKGVVNAITAKPTAGWSALDVGMGGLAMAGAGATAGLTPDIPAPF